MGGGVLITDGEGEVPVYKYERIRTYKEEPGTFIQGIFSVI